MVSRDRLLVVFLPLLLSPLLLLLQLHLLLLLLLALTITNAVLSILRKETTRQLSRNFIVG